MSEDGRTLTVRELADELKTSKQTITNYAVSLGIVFETQGNRRAVSPEQAEQIRQAFKAQHQGKAPGRSSDKKKTPRKASAEDPATTAAIETLRELLQAQTKQLELERAQHRADMERKDGQIEALQSLLSQSQQLQAMQAAQLKALQAPKLDPDAEDLAATGPDDPGQAPAAEDPTPQPEAPQQPEQTTAGPQPEPQPGFWARFKSFFNG